MSALVVAGVPSPPGPRSGASAKVKHLSIGHITSAVMTPCKRQRSRQEQSDSSDEAWGGGDNMTAQPVGRRHSSREAAKRSRSMAQERPIAPTLLDQDEDGAGFNLGCYLCRRPIEPREKPGRHNGCSFHKLCYNALRSFRRNGREKADHMMMKSPDEWRKQVQSLVAQGGKRTCHSRLMAKQALQQHEKSKFRKTETVIDTLLMPRRRFVMHRKTTEGYSSGEAEGEFDDMLASQGTDLEDEGGNAPARSKIASGTGRQPESRSRPRPSRSSAAAASV